MNSLKANWKASSSKRGKQDTQNQKIKQGNLYLENIKIQ
jgi:hypothetical protein